jgi:hypothetical protein
VCVCVCVVDSEMRSERLYVAVLLRTVGAR